MACKISWPDRTQLLKHSQECPNSQVVRTKTKYKLKANHRVQLKFYLASLIEYWTNEREQDSTQADAKFFLKDVLGSKRLLLKTVSRHGLKTIFAQDALVTFEDDEELLHDEN
jgi:hypothetical protein